MTDEPDNAEGTEAEVEEPQDHALDVKCPRCQATAGAQCVTKSGRPVPDPHKARVKAAETAAAIAEDGGEDTSPPDVVPDGITGDWRRVYIACRREVLSKGQWTALAAKQVEAMVRNLQRAEAYQAKVEEEPLVEGSQGQHVLNPLAGFAARLETLALQVAKAYKLTPDTRGQSAAAGSEDADGEPGSGGPADEWSKLDAAAERQRADDELATRRAAKRGA